MLIRAPLARKIGRVVWFYPLYEQYTVCGLSLVALKSLVVSCVLKNYNSGMNTSIKQAITIAAIIFVAG